MRDDGDPVADMAALYERTWPRLIGVLVSIGGSRTEAEEIAMHAYVKLLRRWADISRYDDPDAWVRAVAVRTLLSRLRRHVPNRAMAMLSGRLSTDREPSGEVSDVAAALALITPDQRAVVVLHHVLELPVDRIAEELQMAQGTVRSRLARARPALAPVLEVTGMRDLLTEYVDDQTPDEVPPFEYVEQAARERRRRRYVVAAAIAAVVVVAGAVLAVVRPDAAPGPVVPTPTTNALNVGPPPQQFKIGSTVLLLRGETAVISATRVRGSPSALIVKVARDEVAIEPCVPNTVVRVLYQNAVSIRIAAYRYGVAPDQNEGSLCARKSVAPTSIRVELHSPLGGRVVYAGSTGNRVLRMR